MTTPNSYNIYYFDGANKIPVGITGVGCSYTVSDVQLEEIKAQVKNEVIKHLNNLIQQKEEAGLSVRLL